MKLLPQRSLLLAAAMLVSCGCSILPDRRHRDSLHNPFPQLKRVAVLPFFNQSSEPTVDTDAVAEGYYAALQGIQGFEVLPVGVTKSAWLQFAMQHGEPRTGRDFQLLAQQMGVEAIVVGSVTDYDAYYPPRMALTTHWYAANDGFHPIPAGYGLPWGTDAEKNIPRRIVRESEFELARSQLATQTPLTANDSIEPTDVKPTQYEITLADPEPVGRIEAPTLTDPNLPETTFDTGDVFADGDTVIADSAEGEAGQVADVPMPANWPDPTDLIPDPPSPARPLASEPNHKPVLSHTRIYRGDDPYFTARLADHVETGDDARPGGWQGYLKRSDDFVRYCCHLHIAEMLESRGGTDQSDLILRWPLSRY